MITIIKPINKIIEINNNGDTALIKLNLAQEIQDREDADQDLQDNIDNIPVPSLADLGLDNVDNTSDLNKPISTLQEIALDTKIETITAGDGLVIDNTDPINLIISANKMASLYSENTDTTTNINNNTSNDHIDNVPIFGTNTLNNDDSSFTVSSSTKITCNFTGRVRIFANIHTFSTTLRVNPAIRIKKNGTVTGPTGASSYIRADSGHNEASLHISCCEFNVVSTDYIELGAMAEAASGTSTMRFAGSSSISIQRMNT